MRAKMVWRVGECLAFERLESNGGGKYYFTPLTLEKYYSEVKDSLVSGEDFTSEAEMIEAFLKAEAKQGCDLDFRKNKLPKIREFSEKIGVKLPMARRF